MTSRRLVYGAIRLVALLSIAGFLGAALICLAPGSGVDELELDPRLSGESLRQLRESREAEIRPGAFYWRYVSNLARGELGFSRSLNRPVRELLADRLPATLGSVAAGLGMGWAAALLLAVAATLIRRPLFDALAAAAAGQFLCVPSALVALLLFLAGAPPSLGIAAVVFPRVHRYAHELLRDCATLPHVITAKAKGLSEARMFLRHILPPAAPQLLALAGVSVGMALGAAIPVEVICDSPGIGQLAWKAALARDLPLLVTLTLVIAAIALAANSVADALTLDRGRRP